MSHKLTGKRIAVFAGLALTVVVLCCCAGGMLVLATRPSTPQSSDEAEVVEATVTPQRASAPATAMPASTIQASSAATGLPNPTSANPNSSLTFQQIKSTAQQLTEIKRNDYYKSLVGTNVHWSGTIADVSDSGEVRVRIVSSLSYDVVLQGVPKTTYAGLNLGDSVDFDGTITKVEDLFGSGIPKITVKSTSLNSRANALKATPTGSNAPLTFEGITSAAKQLTEIKRNDYYKSLVGKILRGSGKVADVSNSGEVHVRITSSLSYDVALQGIPKATYTTLNLNDAIEFDGTIANVDDMFGSGHPVITIKSATVKAK